MEKIKVEIRAAEGGTDSKMLVETLTSIYQKAGNVNNFSVVIDQ